MDAKLASVIVPAYNAKQYIKLAIESILAQTFRNFEIIVVDDGSTDDTRLVAQQFGNTIRYIYQDNRGLAAARNTGIRNSQGEIIALLDADDLWEPKFLEVMINLLGEYPDAAGAYCGFQYIDHRGNEVGKPSLKVLPPEKFHEILVSTGNWLSACGVVFRKQLAEDVGLFDESLRAVEDEDLWIRLSAHRPFVGIPEALVKYRRHDSNMSKDPERMVTALLQSRGKIFGSPDSDVGTWSASKIRAYRDIYQSAAIRYLAAGEIQKSADFIQRLAGISWDYVCGMELWRGLVRAHLSEVYQFEPVVQLDWRLTQTYILALLDELSKRNSNSVALLSIYTKIKSSAFLAMADESGRGKEPYRALYWLWMAARVNLRIFFTRPYWGTVVRSFLLKSVRTDTSRIDELP